MLADSIGAGEKKQEEAAEHGRKACRIIGAKSLVLY